MLGHNKVDGRVKACLRRYRVSYNFVLGRLNLVVAAIVLSNTVYLQRATQGLKAHGQSVDDDLLEHLSPLGWEHINLTGDYVWPQGKPFERSNFRPLRPFANP